MEVLSDVLRGMRVQGSVYFCQRLESPWNLEFPGNEQANFHFVRRGGCWLFHNEGWERLGPGDLVFAAPGEPHSLVSSSPDHPDAPPIPEMALLCGYCRFDPGLSHPLLDSLPGITVVRDEELLRHVWLKSTLEQLSREYLCQQPGNELVVDKLTEILLVELIRINFGRSDQEGFVAALADPALARALEALHLEPHRPWTLETLASEAAMSRASLANRFKQRIGQTMFEYLTGLRMHRAKSMLRESDASIYKVANRVGYESDLAFAKAFKRVAGMTPKQYRKSLS